MLDPDDSIVDRVSSILGWTPEFWIPVTGGYTPAARFVLRARSNSAFVKIATTPVTAAMLRREIDIYPKIPTTCRPVFIGADDDGCTPLMICEDLSAATWPPPWDDKRVHSALEAIACLHATAAPLRPYRLIHHDVGLGWHQVSTDPKPFLGLHLCSRGWLNRCLPALLEAESACMTDGNAPCHWDIRSDNICFQSGRALMIDWAESCLSNPDLDLGFWLPSLAHEGGPSPETILPDSPEIAAWVSGFFAARAGLPIIPEAPAVRRVQLQQLSEALFWAQRALQLPALDAS